MKIVQIIAGGYGHRPKANAPAKLILAGEFVCLDDAEADRLVQQGVAVYGEPDEETREIVEQADADGNEPEPHPAAADKTPRRKARKTSAEETGATMTDFREMAMADIDEVFFQEFVEKHTIDGEEFDVVTYEEKKRDRKSQSENTTIQNFH